MVQVPATQGSGAGAPAGMAAARALATGADGAVSNEYLTFAIDHQYYGIDILSVREIRAWTEVTHLPNTPEFVRGIINLRGTIVPIYDLRVRLGGGRTDPTRMHVVIVVEAANGTFGLLVDSVSDILSIDQRDLQAVPDTDIDADYRFLSALVAREERMVSIIDLDRLVNKAAADQMERITAEQGAAAEPAA